MGPFKNKQHLVGRGGRCSSINNKHLQPFPPLQYLYQLPIVTPGIASCLCFDLCSGPDHASWTLSSILTSFAVIFDLYLTMLSGLTWDPGLFDTLSMDSNRPQHLDLALACYLALVPGPLVLGWDCLLKPRCPVLPVIHWPLALTTGHNS